MHENKYWVAPYSIKIYNALQNERFKIKIFSKKKYFIVEISEGSIYFDTWHCICGTSWLPSREMTLTGKTL